MDRMLEHVTFKLVPGTDLAAWDAANGAVDAFLARQPGFAGRYLGTDEDGTWIDVVLWQDRASAEAAAARFPADPDALAAMALMSQEGMAFRHLRLARTVPGPAAVGA